MITMLVKDAISQTPPVPVLVLDLDEIKAPVLRQRPAPYVGSHIMPRADNAEAGRAFLRRMAPHIDSAANRWNAANSWLAVGMARGTIFLFISAKAMATIEFHQQEWVNDGDFIGTNGERDPIIGRQEEEATFTIPKVPVRRGCTGSRRLMCFAAASISSCRASAPELVRATSDRE